jgi:hypothetical protein
MFSTDGCIRFDYGHIGASRDGFHTRQITFPVLFTVYHTLELHSLDLVRAPKARSRADDGKLSLPTPNGYFSAALTPRSASFGALPTAEDILHSRMGEEQGDEWCLLALSFRNVYGVPFEVELLRKSDDKSER